jgi:hypothetical protein
MYVEELKEMSIAVFGQVFRAGSVQGKASRR